MSSQLLQSHFHKNVKYGSSSPIMIHLHIVEGQNLKSADNNGYSDPYFKIKIDKAIEDKSNTDRLNVTLNPIYHDIHTLTLKDSSLDGNIIIEALDYDKLSSNDSLGFASIPLRDLQQTGALSGWFGLFETASCNANQRMCGRFYVRIVLDKDRTAERKQSKTQFHQTRAQLIDLVRRNEDESLAHIAQRLGYYYGQYQRNSTKQKSPRSQTGKTTTTTTTTTSSSVSPPPPPPPSAVAPEHDDDIPPPPPPEDDHNADDNEADDEEDIPLDQIIPKREYYEYDPQPLHAQAWQCTSPAFISSPFQLPSIPVVPLQELNPTTFDANKATSDTMTGIPAVAHKVTLCCASWNVGNAQPPEPHQFRHWLTHNADIYVVSTQENSYTMKDTTSEKHFDKTLADALGFNYELVAKETLGQIYLHIYAKRTIRPLLDVYQSAKSTEATGFGNVISNKGGAAVALSVLGNSFVFISSHLAAHTHMVNARNKDKWEIINGISWKGNSGVNLLSGFHHVFWMGDLNYRLEYAGEDMHPQKDKWQEMIRLINRRKFQKIFKTDQLTRVMKSGEAFVGFKDCPPITFKPTFKVRKNCIEPEYDPKRTPSYTDRVLYKSLPGFENQIILKSFESCETMATSDHKPVAAYFDIFPTSLVPGLSSTTEEASTKLLLRFTHIQCSNLPVGDLNGLSDPFLKICSPYIKGNSIKTSVKKNTLSPVWTESELEPLALTINSPGKLWDHLFSILIYDKDFGSRSLLSSGAFSLKELDVFDLIEGQRKIVYNVDLFHPAGGNAGKLAFVAVLEVIPPKTEITPYSASDLE